jgi:hypothetical protein
MFKMKQGFQEDNKHLKVKPYFSGVEEITEKPERPSERALSPLSVNDLT